MQRELWWDLALDACFNSRLGAEETLTKLENLLEALEPEQEREAWLLNSLPYLQKAMELAEELSEELLFIARSRKEIQPSE